MRARPASILLALATILLLAPMAEAGGLMGWFRKEPKFPKPISVLRLNIPESHKPGNRMRHRATYTDVKWGNMWKQLHRTQGLREGHYSKY